MPKEIYTEDISPGLHPFDAWEWDNPATDSTPNLTLEDPWILEVESDLEIGGDAAITGDVTVTGTITGNFAVYDTGWINRSDWTNVHLGSDDTKDTDSNVTHNLDAPLSDLLVKVLISTDGTDANSFEMHPQFSDVGSPGADLGITVFAVNDNAIIVQTAKNGLSHIDGTGNYTSIDTEDWYYKVVVYKLR